MAVSANKWCIYLLNYFISLSLLIFTQTNNHLKKAWLNRNKWTTAQVRTVIVECLSKRLGQPLLRNGIFNSIRHLGFELQGGQSRIGIGLTLRQGHWLNLY